MMLQLDFEQLSRELVRAVRGERSQLALSRWLGFRTNVLYSWEAGRDFPTAARFLDVAARCGADVRGALERFLPRATSADAGDKRALVTALLVAARGHTPIVELAARSGYSRFAIARWLKGQTEPRLPQLLRLLEASSLRVLDFVAALTDPAQLQSVADAWRDLEATRTAAHEAPWTQAVLRCLELPAYARLPEHAPGFVAQRIGIELEEERRCLQLLEDSGQIQLQDGRYVVQRALAVDTRRDPESTRRLRSFWTRVALERLEAGTDGLFSYNVFGVSEADLARLRELHAEYFQQMRTIIADSEPVERVVIGATQLLALDAIPTAPQRATTPARRG
jgi:hypothetical protein